MKVLDLFAGLKGWSDPFKERGHEVYTMDWDQNFDVDSHRDIRLITPEYFPWKPDIILASPPCETFSVLQIGKNWNKDYTPKTEAAVEAIDLVVHTLALIDEIQPQFWIVENPRGMLRKLQFMKEFKRYTISYCQYGQDSMKPTDLWGKFPPSFHPHPVCKQGDPCHVRAPRGSKTGVQGPGSRAMKAKIPYQLALDVCLAAERDLNDV